MIEACAQTIKTAKENKTNFRVAGFVNALKKIELCYRQSGFTM